MIPGLLKCLGVELPLDVVELGAEFVPKVCLGHLLRLEGICEIGPVEFLGAWVPLDRYSRFGGSYFVLLL